MKKAATAESGLRRMPRRHPHIPYIAPSLTAMFLLFILPIVFVFVISLTNYKLGYSIDRVAFNNFANYTRLFTGRESAFYYSVGISIAYMAICTALQLVIGMFCAMLINCEFKLKGLVIACLIVPIAMTPSIASQIWKLIFNTEFGLMNYLFDTVFGSTVSWLSKGMAFWLVCIASVWQFTPFVTLMIYAGLRSLPAEPYESAALDGANKAQQFLYITLPLMKRLLILCALMRSIDMLKAFDIPYVLTQGGPGNTTKFLGLLIYESGFGENTFVGRSAAVAVVLIAIVSILSIFLFRTLNRAREQ